MELFECQGLFSTSREDWEGFLQFHGHYPWWLLRSFSRALLPIQSFFLIPGGVLPPTGKIYPLIPVLGALPCPMAGTCGVHGWMFWGLSVLSPPFHPFRECWNLFKNKSPHGHFSLQSQFFPFLSHSRLTAEGNATAQGAFLLSLVFILVMENILFDPRSG